MSAETEVPLTAAAVFQQLRELLRANNRDLILDGVRVRNAPVRFSGDFDDPLYFDINGDIWIVEYFRTTDQLFRFVHGNAEYPAALCTKTFPRRIQDAIPVFVRWVHDRAHAHVMLGQVQAIRNLVNPGLA